MKEDFSVAYRTFYPLDNTTYYIKASTEFSPNYAYLPFIIAVTPPILHVHHTPP